MVIAYSGDKSPNLIATIGVRFLLSLARYQPDIPMVHHNGDALRPVREAFPDFLSYIQGRDVVDFGCGFGYQSVALRKAGAARVLGVEIEDQRLAFALSLAGEPGVDGLEFSKQIAGEWDAVISLNCFE